jgi:hypothetical protein
VQAVGLVSESVGQVFESVAELASVFLVEVFGFPVLESPRHVHLAQMQSLFHMLAKGPLLQNLNQ